MMTTSLIMHLITIIVLACVVYARIYVDKNKKKKGE